MSTINLAVGGMTCAGCASNIQRGLAGLEGVEEATVNLATRRATVQTDGTLDRAELEEAMRATITGLGYQVLTPKTAPGTAPGMAPKAAPGTLTSPGSEHGGEHDEHDEHAGHHGQLQAEHAGHHGDHHARSDHDSDDSQPFDEHAAHLQADAARASDLLRRLIIAAILTIPLLAISMVMALQFGGWEWLAFALATPVTFYSGLPFHRSTLKGLRHRAVNMDTLVSMGTVAAWTWSTVVLLAGLDAHVYFETGAVIVSLILLGKWIEVRSTAKAGDAVRALSKRQVNRPDLQPGMTFDARPGQAIATDGIVVEGEAAVDTSLVTGESVPVHVAPGAEVIGGTIVVDGSLVVEATRVGEETTLAQVARMVDEALSGRARIQRLADRISSIFVPTVIGLALATLVVWLAVTGDANRAFTAAVAVLIISCPCALGLATPLATLVGTGRGAQLGILIRGPQVLEDTRGIQTIVLDKTGTVTEGRMAVTASSPDADSALLDAAGAVEARSEHPVAAAIAAWRDEVGGERPLIKGFRSSPGQGVTATVQGLEPRAEVTIGSRRLFDTVPDAVAAWAADREALGETAVFVGRRKPLDGGLLGGGPAMREPLHAEAAIAVRDQVKATSAEAVAQFRDLGLDVVLLTGDNKLAAQAVGRELGIDRVIAGVLPGGKADVIRELQETGADGAAPLTTKRRVAMVGDGVNDSPALAQADLGIALGTGADVAREASDLTIVSGDPRAAATAVRLSRRTLGIIRGNLFWAFAYNVAAIPLAAVGILNPMIASAAMGASSLFVVANSLRLRRA